MAKKNQVETMPEEEQMLRPSKRQALESSVAWELWEEVGDAEFAEPEGPSKIKGELQAKQVIMDTRWADLLPELHRIVLQFIPIPELCRFRTVSREWNDLTKQPSFASKSRPQEAMFIFRTLDTKEASVGGGYSRLWRNPQRQWRIYDPSTHKSFKLSMEFLHEGVRDRFNVLDDCMTLAADKGFVNVVWFSASPNPRKAIQVANPVTYSVVEIPPLTVNSSFGMTTPDSLWTVSLVVAEDYSAFTLYYLMQPDDEDPERKCSFRFQSNVGEWREIPEPPGAPALGHILKLGSTLFTLGSVMANEALFQPQPLLLAFDTTRDTWTDTLVQFPPYIWGAQLATTRGRLLSVAFRFLEGIEDCAEMMLMEIDVASSKCNLVASLKRSEDFNDFFEEVFEIIIGTWHVVEVVGCGDFIVFSCTSGEVVAYDLLSSRWCEWTENMMTSSRADDATISAHGDRHGMYATTMNLTLNPVPAVLQQAPSSKN